MTCTWGDICTLEYGKAFRDCTEVPTDENRCTSRSRSSTR